jgi:hypothetical protein
MRDIGDMGNADSNEFELYPYESSFLSDFENFIGNDNLLDQANQDQYHTLWLNKQLSYTNEQGIDEGQTKLTQPLADEKESNLVGADDDEQSYINVIDAALQEQVEHNQPMGNNVTRRRQLSEQQEQGGEVEQGITQRIFHTSSYITIDDENVIETKKRLGRKRIDASAPTTHASTSGLSSGKKTKKQKMLEEAADKNKEVVCFGNQVVLKETSEYVVKREKNNEAVKKFREKQAQKNLEREVKMPELQKENENLKANLDSLVKGINEIKDNILLLNRGRNLPEDISNLLRQFEEECKNS